MRTVIYVGLITIADAINKNWVNEAPIIVYVTIFIIAIVMDIFEFMYKQNKN